MASMTVLHSILFFSIFSFSSKTHHLNIISVQESMIFGPIPLIYRDDSITWEHMYAVTSLIHWLFLQNFWSHDQFSSNTQVWSIFKLFEHASLVHFEQKKWTNPANSSWFDATWSQTIRIRRFDPFFLFGRIEGTLQTWPNLHIRRKSQWTKLVSECICRHGR